jgi:hypothetical protein
MGGMIARVETALQASARVAPGLASGVRAVAALAACGTPSIPPMHASGVTSKMNKGGIEEMLEKTFQTRALWSGYSLVSEMQW